MTIESVVSSEYPLQPKRSDGKLEYSKVNIGKGFLASITYTFTNKRLSRLNYSIYRLNQNSKNKAPSIVPLHRKVSMVDYIFNSFLNKGYSCWLGWHMNAVSAKKMVEKYGGLKNCNLDEILVKKIDFIAKENNSLDATVTFENERSRASFRFNEYQNELNYEYYTKPDWLTEGSDFVLEDVYLWLTIEPNTKTEKKLNSNRF
ncbi:hypothetical protein [Tenacibaculum dicentrarchi]|uniref:hypothetical protein n=1 Tax=Tenacibaculum dicentrarchi TaxID=669041 RepID=UPI000C7AF597